MPPVDVIQKQFVGAAGISWQIDPVSDGGSPIT
jgi:hypothetical protein